MQRLSLAGLATAACVAAAALAPGSARAASLPTAPMALAQINTGGAVQQVRYVCRRVRVCGRWGCTLRRRCGWRPSYYRYGGPHFGFYFGSRPYYRPYRRYGYRPHWRYRYRRW